MTDDERCYILIRAINQMAGLLYPFDRNSNVSPDKAECLYEVVTRCTKALHEHDLKRSSRPADKVHR
jgi:hypothetical protein